MIKIAGEEIKRGERRVINLFIANLPTRIPITIPVYIFRGKEEGKTLLLTGGIHGNELNGVEIIRKMIKKNMLRPERGSIIAIPLINIFGFLDKRRELPDGRDLNRSFPGVKDGSLASQIAYKITSEILPFIDYGIDFHTGANSRSNYPQLRGDFKSEKELAVAKSFGAKFLIEAKLRENSFRERALKFDKHIFVFEGGESLRFDKLSIDSGIYGTLRVLNHLNIQKSEIEPRESILIKSFKWKRASHSGLFRVFVDRGEAVRKNQILGSITDPFGENEYKIKSNEDGYILGINFLPIVNKGDAIINIGKI